jgi:hypothetical protein
LAQIIYEHSKAALNWNSDFSRNYVKYEDPSFKPRFEALLTTSEVEGRINFKGMMLTPLAFAVFHSGDCDEAIHSLLAFGADITSIGILRKYKFFQESEEAEETLDNALFVACSFVQPECVKILLSKGVNPNIIDEMGSTPLMYAMNSEFLRWSFEIIDLLISAGSKVSTRNLRSQNVFHVMVKRDHLSQKSCEGFESHDLIDKLIETMAKEFKE